MDGVTQRGALSQRVGTVTEPGSEVWRTRGWLALLGRGDGVRQRPDPDAYALSLGMGSQRGDQSRAPAGFGGWEHRGGVGGVAVLPPSLPHPLPHGPAFPEWTPESMAGLRSERRRVCGPPGLVLGFALLLGVADGLGSAHAICGCEMIDKGIFLEILNVRN